MSVTPVPSMTDIPEFPSLADRAAGTYNSKAFAFGTHMAGTFKPELVAMVSSAHANATEAAAQASTATTRAAEAAASATAAASAAGGAKWVAGTNYADGTVIWSPTDYTAYRKVGAGVSNVDPGVDSTGWVLAVERKGLVPVGALVAFDSSVTANAVTLGSGEVYLKTGVIADATAYPDAPAAPWAGPVGTPSLHYPFGGDLPVSMAYGNGVWITGFESGRIRNSSDGMAWGSAAVISGFTGSVVVVFADGYFLAACNATGKIAKSTDGVTWTPATTSPSAAVFGLAYGNGLWVAPGSGTAIFTSPDGMVWTPRLNSRSANLQRNPYIGSPIAFGAGVFVLIDVGVGGNGYSTSPDGINWTTRTMTGTLPSSYWMGVGFGGSGFLITCNDASGAPFVKHSTNGTTWTHQAISTAFNGIAVWPNYINGRWVLLDVNRNTFHSPTGAVWTTAANSQEVGNTISGQMTVSASNGTYSIGMSNGSWVARSEAGIIWQRVGFFSSAHSVNQTVYANGKFLAVLGGTQGSYVPTLAYSSDGLGWVQASVFYTGSANWHSAGYIAGKYLLGGNPGLYYSTDLISWTMHGSVPGNHGGGYFSAGDKIFSLAGGANTTISYSTDGLSWGNATVGASANWYGLAYGNSKYLIWTSGLISTSSDGITWATPANPNLGTIAGVVFAGGQFIAVNTGGSMYKSADGVTWAPMTRGFGGAMSAVHAVITNGTYVVGIRDENAEFVIWPGTGDTYYKRNAGAVLYGARLQCAFGPNNTFFGGQLGSKAKLGAISATPKVLNDVNLKTYNATAADQSDFYKRMA